MDLSNFHRSDGPNANLKIEDRGLKKKEKETPEANLKIDCEKDGRAKPRGSARNEGPLLK